MDLEGKKEYFAIALLLGLSALLLWFSWSPVPYEQDQMSKAAKIFHMSESGTYLDPVSGISGYRDRLFSLYYIVSSIFYSIFGLGSFLSGNVLSAILGVVSSILIAIFSQKNFGINNWVSLFILINVPIFVVTFSYSNEMALAFALFMSSLVVLDFRFRYNSVVSGVLFGAACFSRPDASLLIPFWLIWQYLKADGSGGGGMLKSLAALAVFGFSYSFYILGEIPLDASTGFKWGGNLKLTAAMMSYPFGIPVLVVALYGAYVILLRERIRKGYALLATLLPVLFYIGNLSSPKYLFYLVVPVAVAAGLGLQRMTRRARYASIAFMLVFWVVSISPFGVKFGEKGAHWYLPTVDGEIPTGAYAYFYSKPDAKSHSAKYYNEIKSAKKVINYVENKDNKVTLAGGMNQHALRYVAVKKGYSGSIPGMDRTLGVPEEGSKVIMARRSYLWGMRMSEELAAKFKKWLNSGRIKGVYCESCLFPVVVEVGNRVKERNVSLGERIAFANEYTKGYSSIRSKYYVISYKSLSWVRREERNFKKEKKVYQGKVAEAYRKKIEDAIITRMNMPYRYTAFKNPKSVKRGYNELFESNSK
jgi:hypothetical protein